MNTQLQGVLITGVIIFFIIVLLLLKKRSLSLKYTLLWLLAGLVMAIMVLFPKLLVVLAHLCVIENPMYALYVVCIVFMLCILMALTSIVSKQNQKITTLIQMVGIYEKRMREVEENINKEKMEDER